DGIRAFHVTGVQTCALPISDGAGRLVYEVGKVERGDQDLADKVFLQVNTDERLFDPEGRPLGVFGADIADGPDLPLWSPDPALGDRKSVVQGKRLGGLGGRD